MNECIFKVILLIPVIILAAIVIYLALSYELF